MSAPWEQVVVGQVRSMMLDGHSFDRAWSRALKLHPPRQSDRRRVDEWPEALFSRLEGEEEEPSVVEFLRQQCEAAVMGQKPGLKHFTLDMLREDLDERSSVSHMSDFRLAA